MNPKISPTFWSDPDIEKLPPEQKLAFLWMLTNSQIDLCGVFEVSARRFAFETGLDARVMGDTLKALPRALKGFKDDSVVYVRRFISFQLGNGEQLAKNNIFKSVLASFGNQRNEEIKEALLQDYPVIGKYLPSYVPHGKRDHCVAPGLKLSIMERDGYKCLFTGDEVTVEEAEIDHLVPLSKGGRTVPSNLFCVRADLNVAKNNKELDAFCAEMGFDLELVKKEIQARALKPFKGQREGEGEGAEKEKGDARGEIYTAESRVALHWLNEKSGKHFRECESSLAPINARMKEKGVDLAGVKKMIERQCARWKGTDQEEFLRPQTLFGKEKFDGYYASKDLPATAKQAETFDIYKSL